MSTVFSILGAIGGMVVVVLTIISAINYRKPRKIKLLTNIFYGLFALVSLFVLIFIGGIKLRSIFIIPLITAGMLLGFLRGQSVSFNWQGNQVIGKNSIFFMLFWGFSLTLSLLLGLFDSPLLASLGLIPAVFSSGLQLGYYLNVISRRLFFSRQEKRNKLFRVLIGITGTFLLLLFFGVSSVIAIDETYGDFSTLLNSEPEQADVENKAEIPDEKIVVASSPEMNGEKISSTPIPTPGLLPASGTFEINCEQELREDLEKEEPYPSMTDREYTFDEIFISYENFTDHLVDLDNRKVYIYEYSEQVKRDLLHNPEYDNEPCPLSSNRIIDGEGILHEDGWFTGNFYFYSLVDNCTGTDEDEGYNEFFGYIDDQLKDFVYCRLPVSSWINQADYVVDFEQLKTEGKEKLIENWYNPDVCRVCSIGGISNTQTATVAEQNLPQGEPSGQIKVELLDGNALEFAQPPAQVAYANDQINTAATDIQLAPFCQSDCFRFNEWLGLMKPGDSYDVIFFQETTSVGIQFWGDPGDGIANVYVDSQMVWSGSTEGTDNKYPGGAFVKYLQISNLKPIQNRILRIETDPSGGSVVMYFFGLGEVAR